jgi:flagellar basal body-associated protein FliL
MSEHKKADIVGSTSKGMTTAEKKMSFHSFRLKAWLLIVVGIVILAVVGGVVYVLVSKPSSNKPNTPSSAKTTQTTQGGSQSEFDTDYAMSLNGNPGPLKAYLSQQLAKATTSAQKVQLYNQELVLDLNTQQYDAAISTGTQAYTLLPTSQTADLIGNAYEAKGDKTNAKTWFQNAINNLDKNSPTYHTDLGQYTAELQGVSS